MRKIKTMLNNAWCWIKDIGYITLCAFLGIWACIRHKEIRDAVRANGNGEHIDLINVVENVYSKCD